MLEQRFDTSQGRGGSKVLRVVRGLCGCLDALALGVRALAKFCARCESTTHSKGEARREAPVHLLARVESRTLHESSLGILILPRLQASMPDPLHDFSSDNVFIGGVLTGLRCGGCQTVEPCGQLLCSGSLLLDSHLHRPQRPEQQVALQVTRHRACRYAIKKELQKVFQRMSNYWREARCSLLSTPLPTWWRQRP
jgi:hypothetical protein